MKVDKASTEFGFRVHFEYAVLAMGANYNFPCRAPIGSMTDDQVREEHQAFQNDLSKTSSVLVIGGVPARIEFAGEVVALYPPKKITLLHSVSPLFARGWQRGLGDRLAEQLEAANVETHYNCRVDTGSSKSGKFPTQTFDLGAADFIFLAHGSTPNSAIIEALNPALVNARRAVRVKPTLQLATEDGSLDHVFAVGDLNDIPENKLAGASYWQGRQVAGSINRMINKGRSATQYLDTVKTELQDIFRSIGDAGEIFGWSLGPWLTSKMMGDLGTWTFKWVYGRS